MRVRECVAVTVGWRARVPCLTRWSSIRFPLPPLNSQALQAWPSTHPSPFPPQSSAFFTLMLGNRPILDYRRSLLLSHLSPLPIPSLTIAAAAFPQPASQSAPDLPSSTREASRKLAVRQASSEKIPFRRPWKRRVFCQFVSEQRQGILLGVSDTCVVIPRGRILLRLWRACVRVCVCVPFRLLRSGLGKPSPRQQSVSFNIDTASQSPPSNLPNPPIRPAPGCCTTKSRFRVLIPSLESCNGCVCRRAVALHYRSSERRSFSNESLPSSPPRDRPVASQPPPSYTPEPCDDALPPRLSDAFLDGPARVFTVTWRK